MATPLPSNYRWLADEPGPRMLLEALALFGIKEGAGDADNPIILDWAREIGEKTYTHDSVAWCGLFQALVAKRAGWDYRPAGNPLWALNWQGWGDEIPTGTPMLGDVLVFRRPGGGGHVGQYVGMDDYAYHVLGGNEGDAVNIVRIIKSRLLTARRAPWKKAQPANIRPIRLGMAGNVSENEA